MADVATTTSTTTGTTTDAATTTSTTAAKPWYEGKADAETIGHWNNRGLKLDDAGNVAIEMTKAYRELQAKMGVPADQLLKLPKDASDEAGWKAVHARLGVPTEAKDYDLSGVTRKDGSALDTALADTMRTAMLNAAVPKDRAPIIAKAVVGHMDATDAAAAEARAAALQTDRAALQKDWFPNFEINRLTAMQGAKRAAGSDDGAAKLISAMEGSIGYKATMEFWRKIGAGTTEDTFVDSKNNGGNPTTRAGAEARKAELLADKDWNSRWLAGGAKERQEMANLLLQIHGEAV